MNLTPNESRIPANNPSSRPKTWTRIFESPLFWGIFITLSFGIPLFRSLSRPQPEKLPVLGTLPNFSLLNQDGKAITRDSLRGSVVIANFIYTSCPDVCPLLTQQMRKVQDRMKSANQDVRLLSISVDPETDTPEVLKKYADAYRPQYQQWSFVTGPLEEIRRVVIEGFRVGLDPSSRGVDSKKLSHSEAMTQMIEITHGEHFVIVDQLSQIRAYALANNSQDLNDLVRKVAVLLNTRPPAPGAP